MTTIITKFGVGAPTRNDLEIAELAVDATTGDLYTKLGDTSVVKVNGSSVYNDAGIKADLEAETEARKTADDALQVQIDDLDLSGAIEEAPEDGKQYARQDAAWSEIQAAGGGNGNPVVISDDPPASPEEGDLWYSSKADDEGLYCWDGEVWFEAGGANGADGENGQDAKQIWSETSPDGDIYYSKGNVGIGTDDPDSKLEIKDPNNPIYIYQTRGTVQQIMGPTGTVVSATGQVGTRSDHGFRIVTSNTERMRIDADGKVGIGMTPVTFDLSAKEQLAEWKTKAKKASWPIVTDGAFEQEPTEGLVSQWMETRAAGDKLQVAGNVTIDSAIYRPVTGAGGIRFSTAGNIRPVDTAGTSTDLALDIGDPAYRFKDLHLGGDALVAGKVGIGTLQPQLYSANANDLVAGISETGGNRGITIASGTTSFGTLAFANGPTGNDLVRQFIRADHNDGAMLFATGASEKMRIASNGDATFTGSVTVEGNRPVSTKLDLITTLVTLRKATQDETTLEGLRDSIGDAIGGLIEKFEHEIATMPAPEPEVSTMPAGDES